MRQKKAVTRELRDRYQRSSKKEKVLGYVNISGKRIKYVADNRKIKRKKKKIYGQEVFVALKEIWKICDYICSKRLAPYLKEIIPVLERWGENESPRSRATGYLLLSKAN